MAVHFRLDRGAGRSFRPCARCGAANRGSGGRTRRRPRADALGSDRAGPGRAACRTGARISLARKSAGHRAQDRRHQGRGRRGARLRRTRTSPGTARSRAGRMAGRARAPTRCLPLRSRGHLRTPPADLGGRGGARSRGRFPRALFDRARAHHPAAARHHGLRVRLRPACRGRRGLSLPRARGRSARGAGAGRGGAGDALCRLLPRGHAIWADRADARLPRTRGRDRGGDRAVVPLRAAERGAGASRRFCGTRAGGRRGGEPAAALALPRVGDRGASAVGTPPASPVDGHDRACRRAWLGRAAAAGG